MINPPPYFTANMKALSARNEPVAHWLTQRVTDMEGALSRIFENPMGLTDWRMDDGSGVMARCPAPHILYDPWRRVGEPARDATVIVGTNLGYGLNHVLSGTPNIHKVLVIEPRADMLLACLGQTDFRPFMEIGKLRFVVPDHDQVEEAIQNLDLNLIYGTVHLRIDVPSQQIGPEYARMGQLVKGKLEDFTLQLTTLRHNQETMVGNELKNYATAMKQGNLLPLRGMAEGVTAVILGAGPSLARTGPSLAERPGQALYTAALQTLPALERVGLKPHLCMAIDFRPEMMCLYDGFQNMSWLEELPLIYSTKLDPQVLKRYPGPKIPLWTHGGIGTYVFQKHELVLDAGGNVGISLARFLSWCGVSRILLAGQDFSWPPSERTHAPGHHAHRNVHKFNPAGDVALKNLWGKTIHSNVGYLSARRDLEKDLRRAEIPVFNIYGGGVEIEGSRAVDVDQCHQRGLLTSQPGAMERFLEAVRRVNRPRHRPVYQPRHGSWKVSLRNATGRLEKLMKNTGKHQNEIKGLLNKVLLFLKQDPLYLPYLYNEIMDMAALANCKASYAATDMKEFRTILKRSLSKVKQVDEVLGPQGE